MWLRTSFSDQANIVAGDIAVISGDIFEAPVLVSGLIQGPTSPSLTRFSIIQGSLVINNSSGAVKRYKYIAGNNVISGAASAGTNFQGFGSNYSENIIYAVPTN